MRFGVMCSGMVFQRWQAAAILELQRHGHQPVLLIRDAREVPKKSLVKRITGKRWKTMLYSVLENRLFLPGAKSPVSLEKELSGISQVQCIVDRKGFSDYFRPDDLAEIRSHRLDFMLRFGFNILRGDILDAATHGVWSFHHDDEMKYRGGPAGFWEIYRNDPVSGAILQRLTNKLDGGIILKKGYLQTVRHSWKGNIGQLLTVSSAWPAQVADEWQGGHGGEDSTGYKKSSTTAMICKIPGNLEMIRFLLKLFRNRLLFYYREFIIAEQWNIGVINKPLAEVALRSGSHAAGEITWMPPAGRSAYFADPFGFTRGNNLHVVAEEFDYKRMQGRISGFVFPLDHEWVKSPLESTPNPKVLTSPLAITGEPVHLSYPFIVETGGEIYCLPESSAGGKIVLYKYDPLQELFTGEKTILDNVHAVDPTLVKFQGLWWLYFTDRRYSNTHLYLYHADRLTGEYKPHRLNPVKTDIRSSRPAGTPFTHEGNLYRPAQDCSVTYGGRVVINKVLQISPGCYREEVVNAIEPVVGSKYDRGLHTLSAAGRLTLIDGKYYRADLHYFLNQCRKRMTNKSSKDV